MALDDAKTFELLASGETQGIFQLEGPGMRRYIKELKPTIFSDIAAMVALYRPGPMEQIPTFIKAKQGLIPVHYPHPALKEILEETYGVIVYQEQVIFIAQALAGYSLGQADIFRKAMGKKIPKVMKKEEQNFIAGANKRGIPKELAKEVFSLIEPFAGYAFNKAHSVSYALIAYRTAYLKANYPVEYMTAFLNTYWDNMERVRSAVAECRRLGIKVLLPDINKSQVKFAIEREGDNRPAIRFGLAAIKNVGPSPIEHILSARHHGGEFKSIEDFCYRTDLRNINKRVLESLIKAGAFDSLGSRKALLKSITKIISLAGIQQRMREAGQSSMFDLIADSAQLSAVSEGKGEDTPTRQKLIWERELLGVYFSQSPLIADTTALSRGTNTISCGEITADMANETVIVTGMVVSLRQAYTKERRPFVVAEIEDLDASVEVIVWPRLYDDTRALWQEGNPLTVKGIVQLRNGGIQLNCQEAHRYQPQDSPSPLKEEGRSEGQRRLMINISQSDNAGKDVECLRKVMNLLKNYPGQNEVSLRVVSADEVTNLEMPGITVNYCPELVKELSNIIGEGNLRLEP
jgi:DNA polymerase-3 subunit alpha